MTFIGFLHKILPSCISENDSKRFLLSLTMTKDLNFASRIKLSHSSHNAVSILLPMVPVTERRTIF